MSLRTMLTITAVIALAYGVSYQVAPAGVLELYGVTLESGSIFMARLFGAALIGIGLLTWLIRKTQDRITHRAIVPAMLVYSLVGFVVALHATVSGVMNSVGWSGVAIFLFLSVGYAYLQVLVVRGREPATARG